jgi:hypothetical protein
VAASLRRDTDTDPNRNTCCDSNANGYCNGNGYCNANSNRDRYRYADRDTDGSPSCANGAETNKYQHL